jgi:peptidase E
MIILSSYGFEASIIREKYREYIQPENKTIIILPFAGLENNITAKYEKQFLLQYGFEENNIDVFDIVKMCDIISKSYDYIYVPGGDTFKLLKEIKEFEISEWIKQQLHKGADYIGVSAGANICCQNIKYIMNLEDNNYIDDNFCALGLIDENLICHADQYDNSSIMACKREFGQRDYLLIRNDEVYVIKNKI